MLTLAALLRLTLRRHERERQAQEALVSDAQHEAALSQERFMAAFTHAAIGMAIVGQDGRMLQANQALYALLGCEEAELLGQPFSSLLHEGDAALFKRQAAAVLAQPEQSFSMELRCAPATAPTCGWWCTAAGMPTRAAPATA